MSSDLRRKLLLNDSDSDSESIIESPQKPIIHMTVNEMKEVQKPINAAIYKSKNCYDKPHPNDKIMCELCGVGYTRSNYPKHKITRKHKMCAEMNQKMMKLLLNSK